MGVRAEVARGRFVVRQPCQVEVVVRTDRELVPGDAVEVQFPHSWSLVTGPSYTRRIQASDPGAAHYVSVDAAGGEGHFVVQVVARQQQFPEGRTRHGRLIAARLVDGRVPPGAPVWVRYANTYAPYVAETEELWVRVKGEAPEVPPRLTVEPGPAESLRVLAPSGAEPGEEFGVLVVSLDRFGNASSTRYDDLALRLADGTVVARMPAFVGRVRVPVVVEREGVHRLWLGERLSNAVRVGRGCRGPFWGDLHIHTKLSSDGQGTEPYDYARDVAGLDFAATADHCQSMGPAGYAQALHWAEEADVPGEFATLLADEREPSHFGGAGHYNIYFRDQEAFLDHVGRPGEAGVANPLEAGPPLDPARVMLVPHHTGIAFGSLRPGSTGSAVEWEGWDRDDLRPLVEIYSHHGQSELYAPHHVLSYELNRMRNPERRANTSVPGPYYAQDYWMAGQRLGVVASSDEHSGQGGRPHGGLAAVRAESLSRQAVFDALRARRCYATTGERILVEFSVGGVPMGAAAQAARGQPLSVRLAVWGTDLLLRVEVLRHRFGRDRGFVPILSDAPRPEALEASYELEEECAGPCLYYARVTQEPLGWPGMAWTSPVWIDAPE
ncbi:MAG: DUF3604 domain-containing protein [Candidatus Brocadiia bacterium]